MTERIRFWYLFIDLTASQVAHHAKSKIDLEGIGNTPRRVIISLRGIERLAGSSSEDLGSKRGENWSGRRASDTEVEILPGYQERVTKLLWNPCPRKLFMDLVIAKLTLSAKLGCPITRIGSSDCGIWGPQWDVELPLSEALNFISLRLFLEPQWGFEFNSLRSCFLPQWDRNLCDTFVTFDTDVKNSLHAPLPHWGGFSPHMACFPRPDFLKSEVWFF